MLAPGSSVLDRGQRKDRVKLGKTVSDTIQSLISFDYFSNFSIMSRMFFMYILDGKSPGIREH